MMRPAGHVGKHRIIVSRANNIISEQSEETSFRSKAKKHHFGAKRRNIISEQSEETSFRSKAKKHHFGAKRRNIISEQSEETS